MTLRSALFASIALVAFAAPAQAVDLEFYFPVAVGGKPAETVQALTDAYMAANPDVKINAIYTGSYADTTTKAITAARGGNPPQLVISLSTDMYKFIDEDLVESFDRFVTDAEKAEWIGGFYPAFMLNSQYEGETWGIPFQRSTPVLYWNKAAFEEAGLDPEKGPANWAEMVEMGKTLTKKDDNGNVTQWGVHIPSSGFPSWLWSGIVAGNGGKLQNDKGTEVYFNSPEAVAALEALVALSETDGVQAPRHSRLGRHAESLLRGPGRDDLDHHRQPHQCARQCAVRLRRGHAARPQAAGRADRRRQFLPDEGLLGRGTQGCRRLRQMGDRT